MGTDPRRDVTPGVCPHALRQAFDEGAGAEAKLTLALKTSKHLEALDERQRQLAIGEGKEGSATFRVRAADVLVPRQKVVALSREQSPEIVLQTIRESGHSRFPFTPTGQLDDVSGVVFAKELLLALQDKPDAIDWSRLVHEPLIIPETKSLNTLLQQFRAERRHMAIVVDEYGGTEGIVTLEDVLEELVGEIEDESDRPIEDLWPQKDDSVHALSTLELLKLTEHLGIPWQPDAEIHTLGGLLSSKLERIPRKGDVITWRGYRIEVLSATETRAEVVRLEKLPEKQGSPRGSE